MDVENRQVFFKSFNSKAEQDLIHELEKDWTCFDKIESGLGVSRNNAERWIDALTLRCPLAEKNEGRFVFFKIITDQDFNRSCKTK